MNILLEGLKWTEWSQQQKQSLIVIVLVVALINYGWKGESHVEGGEATSHHPWPLYTSSLHNDSMSSVFERLNSDLQSDKDNWLVNTKEYLLVLEIYKSWDL